MLWNNVDLGLPDFIIVIYTVPQKSKVDQLNAMSEFHATTVAGLRRNSKFGVCAYVEQLFPVLAPKTLLRAAS